MNSKISVIIPFYYQSSKIISAEHYFSLSAFEKCLSSIFKSKFKNYEVIAVSDGSSNESLEIAKKYPCKLIKLTKNSGSGFSRNKGAKIAKGNILVFLDSDVEIHPNTLQIICEKFYKKKSCDAIQGVFSNKVKYQSYSTEYLQNFHCYYLFSATKNISYTESLCTSFFSIKKKLFNELKGFDSNFTNANVEDAEFGYRLVKKGLKILLEKKIEIIHHTNFGIWNFIKRILRIHTGEMKMYLRYKKISMKTKQSNYQSVFFGIGLIFVMLVLLVGNFFYKIPNLANILILLNIIFILLHLKFLKFIYVSKGFFSTLRGIFFSYLHKFLFIICIIFGSVDFYIFRNKY